MSVPEESTEAPFLRVVGGSPDEFELAAVTVAIAALLHERAKAGPPRPPPVRAAPWRRPAPFRSPGAWSSR